MFRKPSHQRDWELDQKILPTVAIDDSLASFQNIRDFEYRSVTDYTPRYYNKTLNISEINSAQIGVVPFSKNPLIVHLLLKFNFINGEHLVFSIEVRKQRGQKFSNWKTLLNNYEIWYVIGDQNDVVNLRVNHRVNEPVHLYKLNSSPTQLQQLFISMSTRAQGLAERPEFFNLFFNSCASNLISHLNQDLAQQIPWYIKYFAPGLLIKHLLAKDQVTFQEVLNKL